MIILFLAFSAAAAAYQILALIAVMRRLSPARLPARQAGLLAPLSILKPLRGLDAGLYENLRSHAVQKYPEFELVVGVSDPGDPALREVERLRREFPAVPVQVVRSTTAAPNGKVGVLQDLAAAARYPILLVNDSDIRVGPDYLVRVAAPLEDPTVGVVTCLYRARASSWPDRFEALGIATDFAPSVLVARLIGFSEFGLGSTLVFRGAELERIGGFAAIADYIADDYQLSRRIRDLGLRVVLSDYVVETSLPDAGWMGVWRHQLRWARTIRLSRGGYAGLPIANATLWAVLLALAGWPWTALALFALRAAAGLTTALGVLGDRAALANAWMMPFRDLAGFAIWAAGLFGSKVVWRDVAMRLDRSGRISKTM